MNIIEQDLLDVTHGVIAHQVNCVGVMGAGLARQIKNEYPKVYLAYRDLFNRRRLRLGVIQIVKVSHDLWVANLAGQYGVGTETAQTDYNSLELALSRLSIYCSKHLPDKQVFFPFGMGCGLAGGKWEDVSRLIRNYHPDAIICKLPRRNNG